MYMNDKKRILFAGIPKIALSSRIKVKEGNLEVGKHFTMKNYSYIAVVNGGEFRIEDSVYINRNCNMICHKSIHIGEHTSIGPNVVIYDHDHCFGPGGIEKGFKTAAVTIGKNCWIGAGSIILKGTQIGEGSIVGAGTIVKGVIPPHSMVISKEKRELSIVPINKKGTELEL